MAGWRKKLLRAVGCPSGFPDSCLYVCSIVQKAAHRLPWTFPCARMTIGGLYGKEWVAGVSRFFEQVVNVVNVVQAVVYKEPKLRYDAQLVAHALAKFVSHGFLVGRDILQKLL